MKKLFTSLMVLFAAVSMSAQDPATWEKGQDVSDQLEWQAYSGDEDPAGVWIRTMQKEGVNAGHFYDPAKSSVGCWEMYNAPKGMGTYQVFPLPAGIFEFKVQGFHRNPSNQVSGDVNAEFFLDVIKDYDPENPEEYTIERSFAEPLMRIAQQYDTEKVVNGSSSGWEDDYSVSIDGTDWYLPNSMWGAAAHFEKGEYDGNSITVAVADGAYVRLGVRMTAAVGNDWVIWGNFRAIYQGNDAEVALFEIAKSKLAASVATVEKFVDGLNGEYGALAALLGDMAYELNDLDPKTVEDYEETTQKWDELYELCQNYYADAVALTKLVGQCAKYTDDPAFTAIVEEARAIAEDQEGNVVDDPDMYKNAYEKLYQARIEYTNSHPDERGAYNYSSLINMPFFCDNDYTPTWDAEANAYIFEDVMVDGEPFSIENSWCTIQEQGYNEAKAEHSDWVPICENYSLSSENVEGQWCMKSTTWHGGGPASVTLQHGYPAVGGWTAEPSGNPELLYQTIVNIPNGYYSMSALMCNAGADISPLQYAYIETTDGQKEIAPLTQKGDPWWGGGRDQWRQTVWEKLSTGMVYVADGQVTIGTASDAFYAATGFQLYYYGENPDFTTLLASDIEETKGLVETLVLSGDKAAVSGMIQAIPAKIEDQASYELAKSMIADIKSYVSNANNYMATWAVEQKFVDLQSKYEEGTIEYNMLEPTWFYALDYPSSEDATYLGAKAIERDYEAYVNYLNSRSAMQAVADQNADLKALLETQAAAISAQYTTSETLASYLEALAAPYNAAVLASLGAGNASASNPIDVTVLLVNPSFDEGNKGWEGSFTVDGNFHNAESWNTSAFTASQTVYSLPAGAYRVQVQAFYRDGGNATASFDNYYYNEMFEPNVKLFANDKEADVMSLCQPQFTEPSMVERVKEWVKDDIATDEYHDIHADDPDYDPNKVIYSPVYDYLDVEADNPAHPWDNKVIDDKDYWYPNSMEGAMNRFAKSPEAYINTVDLYLTESGNITFGVKKEQRIDADWCIFDNFKLFYLGTDAALSISNAAASTANSAIYSVNGVRQNTLKTGLNIVKMSDGTVKKVLNK